MEYIQIKLKQKNKKSIKINMISGEDVEIGKIYQETPYEMKKTSCCTEETKTNIKVLCIFAIVAWPLGRFILAIQGDDKYCNVCSPVGENVIIWMVGALGIALFSLFAACIAACIIGILSPLSPTR